MKLTVLTKEVYSRAQQTLFDLLPKDGSEITTGELVRLRQEKERNNWPVKFPEQVVSNTMRALISRVKENRENFRVCKSYPAGPHQTTYWITTRESRESDQESQKEKKEKKIQKSVARRSSRTRVSSRQVRSLPVS